MRAHLILHRILAVCQLYLGKEGRTEEDPSPPPERVARLDKEIARLGHDPIEWGSQTLCQNCYTQWGKSQRQNVIAAGQCPKAFPWTQIPRNLHHPWRLPPSTGLTWMGRPIHASHSITYYRGVIYCNRCGYYSSGGSVRYLRDPCVSQPPESQLRLLRRMRDGIYPTSTGAWPMPDQTQAPGFLLTYLINGEMAEVTPYPRW